MTRVPVIFLSSTWADLEEHRKALLFMFARLRKWVEAMEYFGALSGEPIDECIAAVQRADVFIGVIGTRYGSKDKTGVSITQREYNEAHCQKKNILIYLIDEENHQVLAKFVDRGEDALKLEVFKRLLKERHTCAFFCSPQDLAMKVGTDLIRQFYPGDNGNMREREFSVEMPPLLMAAGYSLGMQEHLLNLSSVFGVAEAGNLTIHDPVIKEIFVAGYLAVNISRGNFNVLQSILTFDYRFWLLVILLVRHFGVNEEAMATAIHGCHDPLQFRLLTKLAGELRLSNCAEPICATLLKTPSIDKSFAELRQIATPIRDVVREALQSMPPTVLPVIEKYAKRSKDLKRWQQKQVFEAVAKVLRRCLEGDKQGNQTE
ncbi:MAG: DUF4062 domain-containing protein [Candidatus Competibacteraceae bacterium]